MMRKNSKPKVKQQESNVVLDYLSMSFEQATADEQIAHLAEFTTDECIEFVNTIIVIDETPDTVKQYIYDRVNNQ